MALQELWKNKLRTFLSLFGITIGIFCIIGVLATVGSLERNIQNEVKSLGTNTIYVDKWDYSAGGGPDFPWWKFVNRPVPKYEETEQIKARTPSAKFVVFRNKVVDQVEYLSLIHISEPTTPHYIPYAVFRLKKKKKTSMNAKGYIKTNTTTTR